MRNFLKKHYKKCLLGVLSAACVFSFAACDQGAGDGSTGDTGIGNEQTVVFELNNTRASLVLGDELRLRATDTKLTGITWSSADPTVATVDENGLVSAMKEGETTVTATYKTQKATCTIIVYKGEEMPRAVIDGIWDDAASVAKGESLNVQPKVLFNGKTFEDAQWTYTLADPTVGSVEDGVFTAAKVGETLLTIEGSWRGVNAPTLTKTIAIQVIKSTTVVINGGLTDSVRLYTTSEHGGKQYDTETPFVVDVKEDGQALDYEVSLSSGEGVVAYDAATKTVRALTYGTAELTLRFTDGDGVENTLVVPVSVERPLAQYAQRVEYFSALDGELDLEKIFGAKDTELLHAYQETTPLTVTDNKVLGVKTIRTGVTDTQLTVYDNMVGYVLNVDAYTKVIEDEDDLHVFNEDHDGYFVMKNDVTCANSWYSTGTFSGVFNGQGYAIKNYTCTAQADYANNKAGIFGCIGEGAYIKNLAILDAQLTGYSTSALAGGSKSSYYTNSTIENIYVTVKKITTGRPGILMWNRGVWDVINNVVIDTSNVSFTTCSGNAFGVLFANNPWTVDSNGQNWQNDNKRVTNTYVIAEASAPLMKNSAYGSRNSTIWASNDGVEEDPAAKNYVYTGVNRYGDMAAFASAIVKVGSDTEYWLVTPSGLEWLGELPEIETVEFAETIEFFSAMDGELPMQQIFGDDAASIVITDAYQGATKLKVVNNKVLGVATSKTGVTETQITICTAKGNYLLNVEAYTKVLDEESDFAVFDVSASNVDGYYVLKQDIECTGEKMWTNYYESNDKRFFNGVLNGMGHKVNGLKVGNNGLFGALGATAVIENVAFTNVILTAEDYWKNGPFLAMESIAPFGNEASKIENVYISFADFRSNDAANRAAGLIYVFNQNLIIKDVIVEVKAADFNDKPQYGYGVLFETDRSLTGETPNMSNVYVVSKLAPMSYETLDVFGTDEYDPKNNWVIYASNDKETAGKLELPLTLYYKGVERYDTLAKLAEKTTQVGSWKVSATEVVWSPEEA